MRGDHPIESSSEDALDRAPAASSFARSVLRLDASRGSVVGVLGPWGSGKSSFVNLARHEWRGAEVPVVDFNPWLFSGVEQLVDRFFVEVAAQLEQEKGGEKLDRVADALRNYGETLEGLAWIPAIGSWLSLGSKVGKAFAAARERRKAGIGGPRAVVEKGLADLPHRVVVVLDDIDRLTTPEIREVFKLVRLTASFPNLVYVLVFDRRRVEAALDEDNVSGRAYLEKILQLALDVPETPRVRLQEQLVQEINAVVEALESPGPIDLNQWQDVHAEILSPLIRNMRDVRRYTNAVAATLDGLDGKVAVTDVLALEAVRVFLPSAYADLPDCVDALTSPSSGLRRDHDADEKQRLEAFVDAEPGHSAVLRAVVTRLFPVGQQKLGGSSLFAGVARSTSMADRTVAHEPFLRFYLERTVGVSLSAFQHAEALFEQVDDGAQVTAALAQVPGDLRRQAIGYLETMRDRFTHAQAVNVVVAVLNFLPQMSGQTGRGMFSVDDRFAAGATAYRIIEAIEDLSAREDAVRQTIGRVETLSSQMRLLDIVGYREGAGHGLVSEQLAAELEAQWRSSVRNATADELALEHDLARVIAHAQGDLVPPEASVDLDNAPKLTHALLQSAHTEAITNTLGTRAEYREARLPWKWLQGLVGEDPPLEDRIDALKESDLAVDPELLALTDRYRSGWDPERRSA